MSGFVYFLAGQVGNETMVKIGYTGRHPDARARDIQAYSPVVLDIFGYVAGDMALEKKFHATFAPRRIHGEWFHADGKLSDFIWHLANCGAAKRLTTADELETAIVDVILCDWAPHPSVDETEYLASADPSQWRELAEAYEIALP